MDKIHSTSPMELPSKKDISEFARDQFDDIVSCEKDWEKRGLLKNFNKNMLKELREFGKLFTQEDFDGLGKSLNPDVFFESALKIIIRVRLHHPYFSEVNGVKAYGFTANDRIDVIRIKTNVSTILSERY